MLISGKAQQLHARDVPWASGVLPCEGDGDAHVNALNL